MNTARLFEFANFTAKPKLFLIIIFALVILFMDCSGRRNRFQPTYYFPIHEGNSWVFNGEIYKMEITDITKHVGDKILTFTYYDSLDVELWSEKYSLLKNQIFLQSFEPATKLLPTVTFEPALPFAPPSRKLGYKSSYECLETHTLDTLVTTNPVHIDYVVEAVEDVRVPAGTFLNCIKMKISIKYPQSVKRPYFIGDQYWWFAPLVGPVKYDLPSAVGELVELPKSRGLQFEPPGS